MSNNSCYEIARYFGQLDHLKTKQGSRECFVIGEMSQLNDYVRKNIFDEFFPMTVAAYRQRQNNQWFRDAVMSRMFGSDVLILLFDEKERGLGVWVFSEVELKYGVYDKWGMYVGMISIRIDYQGNGIHQGLLDVCARHTIRGHFDFVVSRTQNPVVATAFWRKYQNAYPLTHYPDGEIRTVGSITADKIGFAKTYDAQKMIVPRIYNGEALHEEPFHAGNCLDGRIYNLIDYRKGDAVVLVSRT